MIAVFSKRGCSRSMRASSNPSSSGMQTSMSTTATSFFSRNVQRLSRGVGLDEVLAQLGQDDLVAQQLGRLIVDQQDVDRILRHHIQALSLSGAATCAARRAAAPC